MNNLGTQTLAWFIFFTLVCYSVWPEYAGSKLAEAHKAYIEVMKETE